MKKIYTYIINIYIYIYIFNFDLEKYNKCCFDALDLIRVFFQILTAFAFEWEVESKRKIKSQFFFYYYYTASFRNIWAWNILYKFISDCRCALRLSDTTVDHSTSALVQNLFLLHPSTNHLMENLLPLLRPELRLVLLIWFAPAISI